MSVISGDCQNGFGKMRWASGTEYEGQWKGDKFHGQGLYTCPNGNSYNGEWGGCKVNGRGTFTYGADGAMWEGPWRGADQEPSGPGTWRFTDGLRVEGAGPVVGGSFAKMPNTAPAKCQGLYTWASGTKYEGSFTDGKKHGQGLFTCPNGFDVADKAEQID